MPGPKLFGGVQFSTQLDAVLPRVGHQLEVGMLQLGVGVGKIGYADLVPRYQVAEEEIGPLVRFFPGQQELVGIFIQEEQRALEVGRL